MSNDPRPQRRRQNDADEVAKCISDTTPTAVAPASIYSSRYGGPEALSVGRRAFGRHQRRVGTCISRRQPRQYRRLRDKQLIIRWSCPKYDGADTKMRLGINQTSTGYHKARDAAAAPHRRPQHQPARAERLTVGDQRAARALVYRHLREHERVVARFPWR